MAQDTVQQETPKHTPGPWRLTDEGTLLFSASPAARGTVIAQWERDAFAVSDLEERTANRRLLAAAPDLLAALETMVEWVGCERWHGAYSGDDTCDAFPHEQPCRTCTGRHAIARARSQ